MPVNSRVYLADDVWVRPKRLARLDVVVRAAGGNGAPAMGGGGGSALERRSIPLQDIPDEVPVTVGQQGGPSAFGELVCQGGKSGAAGGGGGYGPFRGGAGSSGTGQSVTMAPISMIAGGGGGGSTGGKSGLDLRSGAGPLWPEYIQSGRGGGTNQNGEWPAGGGGRGTTLGGAGVVTVVEYLSETDPIEWEDSE